MENIFKSVQKMNETVVKVPSPKVINVMNGVFVDRGYLDWQQKRVKTLIDIYGPDFFHGKKILEVGSYRGDLTQMFYNLGANITGTEGSDKNLETCRTHYPHLNFIKYDWESTDWIFEDNYDIIIHWGVLYHLKNPRGSLLMCLQHTNLMFLETLILDRSGSYIEDIKEDVNLPDQSVHGLGSRFTSTYVENIIQEAGFTAKRLDWSTLNSQNQPFYNFPEGDTNKIYRRFWIVVK